MSKNLIGMLVFLFGTSLIALLILGVIAIFKKTLVKRKYIYILLGIITISNIGMNVESDIKENKEEEEYAQKCSTIEGVSQLLEGSVWTYTDYIGEDDKFNVWCKLEFKNNKLYYYEVNPSKGEWGEPQVCDYTIEERRYSNTGTRYIGVFWEGFPMMKYVFVPAEKSISYKGNRMEYVYGAHLTMEDANPWH